MMPALVLLDLRVRIQFALAEPIPAGFFSRILESEGG